MPQLDWAGALIARHQLGGVGGGTITEGRVLLLYLEDGGVEPAEEPLPGLRLHPWGLDCVGWEEGRVGSERGPGGRGGGGVLREHQPRLTGGGRRREPEHGALQLRGEGRGRGEEGGGGVQDGDVVGGE